MIRLTLHLTMVLGVLFCAALGAMRAQPYDDGGLAASLNTTDCAAAPDAEACFLGIRPGVTTATEAVSLLRVQPWVGHLQADTNSIVWRWNGQQPRFLPDDGYVRIRVRDGLVQMLSIETNARAADLRIVLGVPQAAVYLSQQMRDSAKNYYDTFSEYAVYPAHGLEAVIYVVCPSAARSLWNLPIMLVMPPNTPVSQQRDGAFMPLPETCRP